MSIDQTVYIMNGYLFKYYFFKEVEKRYEEDNLDIYEFMDCDVIDNHEINMFADFFNGDYFAVGQIVSYIDDNHNVSEHKLIVKYDRDLLKKEIENLLKSEVINDMPYLFAFTHII